MNVFPLLGNLVTALLSLVILAGCEKVQIKVTRNISSRFEKTVNGHRTITRTVNGVTQKLSTANEIEIKDGRITRFPKGTLVTLETSGSPDARKAELREAAGALELWITESGASRRALPDEEAWLEGFLRDVGSK